MAPQEALNALDGLFATHEMRVLGIVGILTGYLSVLFVKMIGLLSVWVGVIGIVFMTLMLLLLDPQLAPKSSRWWLRACAVIVISVVITSPQMFYAWTVAVRETQAQAIADLVARSGAVLETQGKGTVTPGTPK